MLVMLAIMMPANLWAAYGDTFTGQSIEGIEMIFKIISEEEKTCQVGDGNNTTINRETKGKITIPDSIGGYRVTVIGGDAFSMCYGISSIEIPKSVTKIESWAFYACNITSIFIPKNVTSISSSSFLFCSELEAIVVEEGNEYYDSRDNCNAIIETATNKLLQGCQKTIIPNTVITIGRSSFDYQNKLAEISIPASVTTIEHFAFTDCNRLTSVTIPKSVTSIVGNVFAGCYNLLSINVEEGNPVYDSRDNCNAIIETTSNTLISGCCNTNIPENITSIGNRAFYDQYSLKISTIPSSVTNIGEGAFMFCDGITSFRIPSSVTNIGAEIFHSCKSLTEIIVDSNNPVYDSREDCNAIIETASNTLIAGCGTTVIPNSVTSISPEAIVQHFLLTDITIPNSVTSIGSKAFDWCSNLLTVTSLIETPFEIKSDVFYSDIYDNAILFVPDNAVETYRNTAGWSNFRNIQGLSTPTLYTVISKDSINGSELTFLYDDKRLENGGMRVVNTSRWSSPWDNKAQEITSITFDSTITNSTTLKSTAYWFSDFKNLLAINGIENLRTDSVTNMNYMFKNCDNLTIINLSNFKTDNVTDMSRMFSGCSGLKTIYVGSTWSTSAVTEGSDMFGGCTKIVGGQGTTYDADHIDATYARIDGGPTSETPGYFTRSGDAPYVVEAYAVLSEDSTVLTFYYDGQKAARNGMSVGPFSGYPDYQTWYEQRESITRVVFDASFAGCTTLTSTAYWFYGLKNLTSITGISNLKTDNVTDMTFTFGECSSLTSLDVSGFKTDKVTGMSRMFSECSSLTSLDVSGFNTGNVTSMADMFYECSGLASLDVTGFKTDNVTNMGGMFFGCSGLTSLDVSGFKTDNVTDMLYMFAVCSGLTSLDLSNFNTANVTNMMEMFSGCSGLTSLDLSNFNTANVTRMSGMFFNCSGLTSLDVSGFKTDNVTDMYGMFYICSGLTSLDVSGFKTDNVTNMSWMFADCQKLTSLDLGSFKTDNVTNMKAMFDGCSILTSIYVSSEWTTASVTEGSNMFRYCTNLVGGQGTTYDANHTDYTYAHIDGGTSNPGYLTQALAKGDANGDGSINIADAVATVTNILGQSTDGNFYKYAADMNTDNVIDIFDVTMIVNAAFESSSPAPALTRGSAGNIMMENMSVTADADYIYLGVDQPERFTATQFDVTLPEGMELVDVRLTSPTTDHQLSFVKRGKNEYRVIALSMSNATFRSMNGQLIKLEVSGSAVDCDAKMSNVLFVTPSNKTVTFIEDVKSSMSNVQRSTWYDLNGRKLDNSKQQLGKGIYMMNHKKVIIK